MGLFSSSSRKHVSIMAILSATGVEILAFNHGENSSIQLIYIGRHLISSHFSGKDSELATLLSSVLKTLLSECLEVLNKNPEYANFRAKDIVIAYSEPFAKAMVYTKKTVWPKLTNLRASVINEVLSEARNKFEEEAGGSEGGVKNKFSVIEQTVLLSKINGYPVKNYFLRNAKELELSIFFGGAKIDLRKKILGAVHSVFSYASPKELSIEYVLHTELQKILPGTGHYLYALVLPERTVLVHAKEGVPVRHFSINFGGVGALRAFAKKLSVSAEVSRSYINLYVGGKLHGASATNVEKAADYAASLWIEAFVKQLADFEEDIMTPRSLYFVSSEGADSLMAMRMKIGELKDLHGRFTFETVEDERIGIFTKPLDSLHLYNLQAILAMHAWPRKP